MATAVMPEIARVREVGGSLRRHLRGVVVVWRRELIRFGRDRTRMITSLVQPVLFLFVLGTGLSTIARTASIGVSFETFMFPGIVGMTVLFTSVFSAISIVWDREFGFLREMLVAPVPRWSLVLGKCLGGTTVATIQGCIFLAFAGAVGVPYSPVMLVEVVGEMALMAFTLTAFGVLLASRMQQMQSFQVVVQFFVMPMFFLSGAMFPLSGLPSWLTALTKVDPLSYAVDPLRRAIFDHLHASPLALRTLDPGISWNGWKLPVGLELGMVAVMAAVLLGAGMVVFSKTD
ncbi:MAG: ABC transporter permease [Actinomycetota bacterium]|nr:ABC transporter permease [Actinomycetota bacterium]